MSVIFLLGPGMWDPARGSPPDRSPLQTRRELAKIMRADGHRVILMEDDPDRANEDMIQKFDRLLRQKVTDVILYWPPLAKMQTTYDELILLCDRRAVLKKASIRLWALHHSTVAKINQEEFTILESGNRSRYLTAAARLGIHPLEWRDHDELLEQARLLSKEL